MRQLDGVSDAAALDHCVMMSLPRLVHSELTVWTQMDPTRRVFKWAHGVDQGIVLLADGGGIVQATRQARAWLSEYFSVGSAAQARLPTVVSDWLRSGEERPLVIERNGRQLLVRLCTRAPERLLLLEERS